MWKAVLLRSLRVVMLIITGLAVALFFFQDGMIYMPRQYRAGEIEGFERDGLVRLGFETDQGKQGAFFQPAEDGEKPDRVWLVFGGNGGRSVDYRNLASERQSGYLFIDYPGYGVCAGKPTPKRIDATVDGALAALENDLGMHVPLAVFGHSLGAAVGLRAAVRHRIERIVLVAPFTTMKEMAAGVVGGLFSNVLRHRFDNLVAMEALVAQTPTARVTIVSGRQDREVPATMGQALAREFPEVTEFLLLEDVGHNDIIDRKLGTILQVMATPVD